VKKYLPGTYLWMPTFGMDHDNLCQNGMKRVLLMGCWLCGGWDFL